MNCARIRELLSAYYDDELSSDVSAEVSTHLANCQECSRELEGYRHLTHLAGDLARPVPPARVWSQLQEQLEQPRRFATRRGWTGWLRKRESPHQQLKFAIAAVAVAVFGAFGYWAWSQQFYPAGMLDQYVDAFSRNPAAAQELLIAKFSGKRVSAGQAIQTVGYTPSALKDLPEGYSLSDVYLMEMPCCKCVQCLCNRADGSTLAVFEHKGEQTEEWFTRRPQIRATCNQASCCLVDLGDELAGSWRIGSRHITVIGFRDINEIGLFVDRWRVSESASTRNGTVGELASMPASDGNEFKMVEDQP